MQTGAMPATPAAQESIGAREPRSTQAWLVLSPGARHQGPGLGTRASGSRKTDGHVPKLTSQGNASPPRPGAGSGGRVLPGLHAEAWLACGQGCPQRK